MRVEWRLVARYTAVTVFWVLACFEISGRLPAQMDAGGEPAMTMGAGRGVQGTITAVAADRLTVKTERGEIYQVALSANTRIMKIESS